jgi:hypothetical protein
VCVDQGERIEDGNRVADRVVLASRHDRRDFEITLHALMDAVRNVRPLRERRAKAVGARHETDPAIHGQTEDAHIEPDAIVSEGTTRPEIGVDASCITEPRINARDTSDGRQRRVVDRAIGLRHVCIESGRRGRDPARSEPA